MDLEGFLFLSMLVLALFISIGFVIIKVRKVHNRSTLLLQALGLGFILFAAASLASLVTFTDALNLVSVWIIYTLAYIVSSLINVGIIVYKKR
jgi:hypothetical protein